MTATPATALAIPPANRPRTREDDLRTFNALGSGVRVRILESIAAKEKSISELARELHIHPATARYHLATLREQGLVHEVETVAEGKVGRPPVRYRAANRAPPRGFPERHYDLLGQLALEAFAESVGAAAASDALRRKGAKAGRAMVEGAAREAKVDRWTPEAFERFVLGGLLADFGVASEVTSRSPGALEYRSFTCPFLELAEKMPELVCNALDIGFHDGVDEALGGVRTARRACMGNGDPYCEYRLEWEGAGARKAAPRKVLATSEGKKRGRGRRRR